MGLLNIIKLSIAACFFLNAQEAIKTFYFEDIQPGETQVYKFVDENDPDKVVYWRMEVSKDNKRLITYTYNSDFFLQNEFHELITEEGAIATKYINFYEGIEGPIEAEILENDVYRWNQDKPISYKVEFKVYGDEVKVEKKRTFIKRLSINYKGGLLETKLFRDDYDSSVNGENVYQGYMHSYYAEGLGIVRFDMIDSNGVSKMKLFEILSDEEFKKMIK